MSILKLDDWQEEILKTEGNICLRSGRQVGKSTIISIKAAEFAVKNPNKTILVIASVERQAFMLFEKILGYIYDNFRTFIRKGKERPTKHKLKLNNGSMIYCLPTGLSGYGIRGYTVDLLIADEAAFIPEDVWQAVTPMLSVTKGKIILLSTPHGKSGYFFSCFQDPNFRSFHKSSEDCPRIDKHFLEREKKRMTKAQYGQEYLGEFIDELRQFFPTDLIKKCMTLKKEENPKPIDDTFLGVDIARMGKDESVLISVERIRRSKVRMFDMEITEKTLLTETTQRIKSADGKFNYKKIFIDDGGMGVGVYDSLLEDWQTKRKVIAINNATRSIDNDDRRKKKLLKEDLYNNLLNLMEKGVIELFDDAEIMLSLKSMQYEYSEDKNLKIFGSYSHIAEALVRAAWCVKNKALNIYIY